MISLTLPPLPSAALLARQPVPAISANISPWRQILAVEPDAAALHAGSLHLTKADYSVTRASSERDLFTLRSKTAFAVAILSDRLGRSLLATAAQTVRTQWPRARILILGQTPRGLEDYLYDEQIDRSPHPQQVLADLESLYRGMWNQRSNTLDWNATRSVRLPSSATNLDRGRSRLQP